MAAKKAQAASGISEWYVRPSGYADGAEIEASSAEDAVKVATDEELVTSGDDDTYYVYSLVGCVRRRTTFVLEAGC